MKILHNISPHERRVTGAWQHCNLRRASGAVLVELTILIPLLVVACSGVIDMGRMIRLSSVIVEASRHGARNAGARATTAQQRTAWCSLAGGAMPAAESRSCDVVAALVPGSEIEATWMQAMQSACGYVAAASGMGDRSGWRVDFSVTEGQFPTNPDRGDIIPLGSAFEARIALSQISTSGCLWCLLPFVRKALTAVSTFPLQVTPPC